MLDGEEILQIACGELRWDRASWTETKPWKSFAESFARRERDSMLDGQESAEIACGELCWDGKEMLQSLRRASLGGSDTACWTDRKPCK